MQAYTLHVKWHPDKDLTNGRDCSGFYILNTLPNLHAEASIFPKPFVEDSGKSIEKTVIEAFKTFSLEADTYQEWTQWNDEFSPKRLSAIEYRTEKPHLFDEPFVDLFRGDYVEKPNWKLNDATDPVIREELFEWPLDIALALPSVVSQFNKTPVASRLYISSDAIVKAHILAFKERTIGYYNELKSPTWRKDDLVLLIKRRIGVARESLGYSGKSKALLVGMLQQNDKQYMDYIYRNLLPQYVEFIETKVYGQLSQTQLNEDAAACLAKDGTVMRRLTHRQLR